MDKWLGLLFIVLVTQTSHIKNCLETLKNKGNLAY